MSSSKRSKLTDLLLCPKCGHSLSGAMRADIEAHIRREFEEERQEWLSAEKVKIQKQAKAAASEELTELREALEEKEKSNEKLQRSSSPFANESGNWKNNSPK